MRMHTLLCDFYALFVNTLWVLCFGLHFVSCALCVICVRLVSTLCELSKFCACARARVYMGVCLIWLLCVHAYFACFVFAMCLLSV